MKSLSASFLATIAIFVAGGSAFGQTRDNACQNGVACDPCLNGGRCYQGPGYIPVGDFWTRNRLGNGCLGRCCATKAYPDAGWAPPAHLPVNHDGAWYGSYWPQAWYGTSGGGFIGNYPSVYEPTDTTQLGYYYHKVPTWQQRPGMIPPTPNPAAFHARVCTGNGICASGGYHQYGYNCQPGAYGTAHLAGPHNNVPNGQPVVRPASRKQGLLGGFRLSTLTEIFD